MAIKVTCPRCKKPLAAPNDRAGSYAHCPACHGRFWVPQDASADGTALADVVAQAPPPATAPVSATPPLPAAAPMPQRPSAQPVPAPPALPPAAQRPAAAKTGAAGAGAPASQPPPPPGHKTARFIAAEAAQSTLKLTVDGKLPELHLAEGQKQEKREAGSSSLSPVALFGLVAISVTLSLSMILLTGDSEPPKNVVERAAARQLIEDKFFGAGNLDRAGYLEPYQEKLRAASRHYARGDYKTERKLYLEVLNMLRAERPANQRGLTGSRAMDKELEENLKVLLSDQ